MSAVRSLLRAFVVLVFASVPALAQLDLEGLYAGVETGDWAEYALKINMDGEAAEFEVKYTVDAVGVLTVTVVTERVMVLEGGKKMPPRKVSSAFKRNQRTLEEQLKAIKQDEGWSNLRVDKLAKKAETVKLSAGGKDIDCIVIEFEYAGMLGSNPAQGKETLFYNAALPVMKLAKVVGSYETQTAAGARKQILELTFKQGSK